MTPNIRYPSGPITPHGAYHILHDRIPQVALRAYDDSTVFNMMGGLAIPDRMVPERVELLDLKGLVPPWRTIDQKGATQDGVTFVDALYDPIEVEMTVKVKGRDPAHTRTVVRDLLASIDPKQESELSWTTHYAGRWWSKVRWFKTPVDAIGATNTNAQKLSLRLRADSGFWESYPNVADFRFSYAAASDEFAFVDADDLGTNWTVAYTGAGAGNMSANGSQAVWVESGSSARTGIARRVSSTSTTDNQVVEIQLGTFAEWFFGDIAFNDIWARMNNSGTPGTSGIRLRFGYSTITLSYFNAGAETVMRQVLTIIPPLPGEKWTLVAGSEGNSRMFKVMRSGVTVMSVKETGTGSPMGASNRSWGFGMHAGVGQMSPSAVRYWTAGTNATVSQTGYLKRINVGDQPFWDRYTCFGPGTFRFGNGPNSTEMVEFGPLLPNQIMQVRTDPRKRGVVDMTTVPPTPQELTFWQQALKDFISFATGNNVPPLLQELQSLFGINPPQGNPYALLHGRFSNPIPPKSPGKPLQAYNVRVEIDDGNADSKVIAAGTPLRRLPY